MSTKSSIAWGDSFHFYEEIFDDDFVYLELRACEHCGRGWTNSIAIPRPVWEVIRRYSNLSEARSLCQATEEELRQEGKTRVEERIQEVKDNPDGLGRIAGALLYGNVDDPPEEQVERYVEFMTGKVERAKDLVDFYNKHEANYVKDKDSEVGEEG